MCIVLVLCLEYCVNWTNYGKMLMDNKLNIIISIAIEIYFHKLLKVSLL